jgi:hypothetical protein
MQGPQQYQPPPLTPPQQQLYQPQQQYNPNPPPLAFSQEPPPPAVAQISKGEEEREGDLPTGDIEGAALTPEMKAKIKAANVASEEDASQGGERFRKLMERAKQAQFKLQQRQQIYGAPPPPQPQNAAPLQIPPDALNLPVEEQARLFRELMARQQMQQLQPQYLQQGLLTPPPPSPPSPPSFSQQQYNMADPYQQQYAQSMQQYQQPQSPFPPPPPPQYQQQYSQQPPQQQTQPQYHPPPQPQHPQYVVPETAPNVYHPQTGPRPNYLEHGVGFDGRRIGRNRDADTISNSADAYLARLKRDSTTRNLARYVGDEQKANEVFHDPGIQDIQAPELNPYLEEQRQRERDMLETAPEEMLIFQEYNDEKSAADKTYSGISYKDKVAQLKARRNNNGGSNTNS